MHPVLKDWLQNFGCLLPLGFFGFCMALIGRWITTETGPARAVIILQARLLKGQYSSRLTLVIFLVPTLLCAWLVFIGCRRILTRLGVYERPTTNAGFEHPNGNA
ncbi:MAG: hypothetical protein F6K31_41005 [Symploca sp. SIO2G7]|nr:hypothetical protein [Symploca sp. SIO2G7]